MVAVTTLGIVALTILALHSGITIIYQNAYYIPIILACYFFQRKGLYFSVGLICIYFFSLVLTFSSPDIMLQGMVRVLFFLLIAMLVTYLSETISREKSRYKGIFSTSESGILLYRKDTLEIIEANPQSFEITGYTMEELCTFKVPDLFIQGDGMGSYFIGGTGFVQHFEAVIRHKDGTIRTVLFSTGSAEYGIGTVTLQDISIRKRAEEAIKTSE
ncbi:MAG: PAS domain-containing protein [Methanolinea sp.]|nr:PAS domain-containing protein [Methanolinea sp.]